jgi:hypothetical protein
MGPDPALDLDPDPSIIKQKSVLRMDDILVWIRIRIHGSMPLTNGSGFDLQDASKKNKFLDTIFYAYYFWKLHLHHFSKIKSQKESQNSTVKALSSVKGPKFGQCRVYLQKELSTRKIAVTDEC